MNKILILLISTVICGSVYSADDLFNQPQTSLMLKKQEPQYEKKNGDRFDFFESFKQQEQDRINQRNYDLEKQHEIQANTSNMSPHDKSQYFLEHRHLDALNAHDREQQFNLMQKARNRGVISEQDYQQKIVKQPPFPSDPRSNQLRLSIPIGE